MSNINRPSAADIRNSLAAAQSRVRGAVAPCYSIEDHAARQERASINEQRVSSDQGAHLLSLRSKKKVLNTCAPDGAAGQQGGFVSPTWESKTHALRDVPQEQVASFHSPTWEEDETKGCAEVDPEDISSEDPDFYQIKADLYDNEGATNSTRFRMSLHVRARPDMPDHEAIKIMADFYNRPRDMNKRLKLMGMDQHPWYAQFKAQHERWNALDCEWIIPPKMAILKELRREGHHTNSEVMGFAAALLAHEAGTPHPVIEVWVYGMRRVMELDLAFTRRAKASALLAKGIYRDVSRVHLDAEHVASKPKFTLRRF